MDGEHKLLTGSSVVLASDPSRPDTYKAAFHLGQLHLDDTARFGEHALRVVHDGRQQWVLSFKRGKSVGKRDKF